MFIKIIFTCSLMSEAVTNPGPSPVHFRSSSSAPTTHTLFPCCSHVYCSDSFMMCSCYSLLTFPFWVAFITFHLGKRSSSRVSTCLRVTGTPGSQLSHEFNDAFQRSSAPSQTWGRWTSQATGSVPLSRVPSLLQDSGESSQRRGMRPGKSNPPSRQQEWWPRGRRKQESHF